MELSPYSAGYLAGFIIGVLIVLVIILVISIFFLLTLQNALKQCAPQNQRMAPGMVWLSLIPVFSYFWNFKVITAVADSLAAEYQMRNIPRSEERPGYQVGMAYAILTCGALIQYTGIPLLGQLCGLAGFVCWIIYWVRIARFKRELSQHQFQFGQYNPNVYQFPNQFPGQHQPNQPYQQPGPPQQYPPQQPPHNPYR